MTFDITIIIPFLNEENNIDRLVAAANEYVKQLDGLKVEIIFVDDGSTDDSVNRLKQAGHTGYAARVIKFSRNFGSHAALRAGFRESRGNYTTFLAADLQTPFEYVGKLYRECLNGFDVVWLSRSDSQDPGFKRLGSRMYSALMRSLCFAEYPDRGLEVAMISVKVKDELNAHAELNSSVLLQIVKLGYKQSFLPYEKQPRTEGRSRWTFAKNVKLLVDSLVSFSSAPIRWISYMGMILLATGVLVLVLSANLVAGLILLCAGITNLSIGIVGEYIWRTLEAASGRGVYVVHDIIDLN